MKQVDIYTDGSCLKNPGGPGGWAAILVYRGIEKVLNGSDPETTNNRMELTAAIMGLSALKEACEVTLYSDSNYLVRSITEGWVFNWSKKNWIRKQPDKMVPNADLWQQILKLISFHKVTFIWVKGHDGHPYNERCDRLALSSASTVSPVSD